jgi:phage/plasmid-associated DNA primase
LQLIICTNYLPRTDKTWSVALRRRLQLVCFVRRYFSPHEKGYNPADPLHGQVDTRLLAKLSTLQNMQELLAWLVAGAVKWYQNGQQLYPMPKRSTDALQDYEEAADDFDNFVLNSCVKGDDLFISTSDALKAYNDPQRMAGGKCVGHIPSLDTKSLKSAMNNHGFSGPDKPNKLGLGVKYCGVTERGYNGLALKALEVKME